MKRVVLILLLFANTAAAQQWWDGPRAVESDAPTLWGPNIAVHTDTNAIDPLVHTSTISGGGYAGMPNLIGDSLQDTAYLPGQARIALIGGGYDNTNNQLAGTISGGAHHFLWSGGDHGTVSGGSWNTLYSGSYSTIGGGTHNSITGTGSAIGGGNYNIIDCAYCFVGAGYINVVKGNAATIAGGREVEVYADNAFGTGRENRVQQHAFGSAVFGYQVESTSPGSLNVSGRGADGQSIVVNLNNRTVNAETVNLLGKGSWTTPVIPTGSVWSGSFNVTVSSNTGQVDALRIDFAATATRVVDLSVTEIADEIGVADPSMTLSNQRILIIVTGVTGHTLTWNAAGVISQAN